MPFCASKCNYCDFYSFAANDSTKDLYTKRVIEEIKKWGARIVRPIDSVYLGGGTPSLLGGDNISAILHAVADSFELKDPEITLECNPADDLEDTLYKAAHAGVNRLSIGVQSGVESELLTLGRRHKNEDVGKTIAAAKSAGIDNISLDLMIGLPESDKYKLNTSLDFVLSHDPSHISVYMLKIEEGTPFYNMPLSIPDEESEREQYLLVAERLKMHGYDHYEISNFAKNGKRSRHNIKYWNCDEYLGIGPAAHSFINGRRFYYPRDFESFINGVAVEDDGSGGEAEEYLMLRLRLSDGVRYDEYKARFGEIPKEIIKKAESLEKLGLIKLEDGGFSLTDEGFLVSNAVIGEFI